MSSEEGGRVKCSPGARANGRLTLSSILGTPSLSAVDKEDGEGGKQDNGPSDSGAAAFTAFDDIFHDAGVDGFDFGLDLSQGDHIDSNNDDHQLPCPPKSDEEDFVFLKPLPSSPIPHPPPRSPSPSPFTFHRCRGPRKSDSGEAVFLQPLPDSPIRKPPSPPPPPPPPPRGPHHRHRRSNHTHSDGSELPESATLLEPDTDPNQTSELWDAVYLCNEPMLPTITSTSHHSVPSGPYSIPLPVIKSRSRPASLRDTLGVDVSDSDLLKARADDTAPHRISTSEVDTFVAAIQRASRLPGLDTILELADTAQQTLFRAPAVPYASSPNGKAPSAVPTSYNTPSAVRILGANPGIQDEAASLWHHSPRVEAHHHHRTSGAHVSFWLLIANAHLGPFMTQVIRDATGTLHGNATAPYLSVKYCIRRHCSHRAADGCNAVVKLSEVGEANLYNRYLLREELAYVEGRSDIDIDDVVHFAIMLG